MMDLTCLLLIDFSIYYVLALLSTSSDTPWDSSLGDINTDISQH